MFVFLLVTFLLFLGVAVDIGTISRKRMQMQKALDLSILAGLSYRLEAGPGATSSEVQRRARLVLEENLRLDGIPVSDLQLTGPSFNNNTESLFVSASYRTPLVLLPFVPTEFLMQSQRFSQTFPMSAGASGSIPRANVILVVDTSGSMACPVSNPNCNCLNTGTCDLSLNAPGGLAKIYHLRKGIYAFLKNFREGWDRVALVGYDTVAETLVDFDTRGPNSGGPDGIVDGYRLQDFERVLGLGSDPLPAGSKLFPAGLTNPSDAFMTAYDLMKSSQISRGVSLYPNERVTIVNFTDGAPSAETGCYNSPTGTLRRIFEPGSGRSRTRSPRFPALPSCPSGNRLVRIGLEWEQGVERLRNSSPLYDKNDLLAKPRFNTATGRYGRIPHSFINGPAAERVAPVCGTVTVDFADSLQPCLVDLASQLPNGAVSQQNEPLSNWKQSFYHRALAFANFLERGGIGVPPTTVFGIGFGPVASPAFDPKLDIYQNLNDDLDRHDGFMWLFTNDVFNAKRFLKRENGTFPAMPFSDFYSMENRLRDQQTGADYAGSYTGGYQDGDPQSDHAIEDMFMLVAHKILIRLTI